MDIKELHSFKLSDAVKFHDKLNPKLWVDNKLDPKVRNHLLDVAEDFISELGIKDVNVENVTVSGSNAAYSYTPHSDLDLHIVVDMSKLPDNEVYQELFKAKKTLYNDAHDITVHGVPVEVYVQDSNLPVVSLGEYSILHDRWIKHPIKRRANFDQNATRAKYEKLADLVGLTMKTKDLKRVDDVLKLIKRYRQAGLSKGGEFSPENLAYKAIRTQGGIDKLYDLSDKLHSQALSIEEAGTRDDALLKIKKLQNTTGRTPSEIESITRIIEKMMKQYNIKPEEIGRHQPVDPFKSKLAKAAYEKQMAAAAMKDEWERFKHGIFAEESMYGRADDDESEVVHHVTPHKFSEFNPLSHFGTKKAAGARAFALATDYEYGKPKKDNVFNALAARLRLGNVVDIDDTNTHTAWDIAKSLCRRNIISKEDRDAVPKESGPAADKILLNILKVYAIDTLRYTNDIEDPGSTSYIITDPSQVRILKRSNNAKINFEKYRKYNSDAYWSQDDLLESYTTKQQVIDHFVRSAKYRGEDVNLAARKGAAAWERGWRGPKPKKPAEIKPYDPERYKNIRLPYIDESAEQDIMYHVTPTKNLRSIMKNGLRPQIGDRSAKLHGEENGIFLFPTLDDVEDAVSNWLGDEFDEDEDLTLLAIDVSGLPLVDSNAGYEKIAKTAISPDRISVSNELMLEDSGQDDIADKIKSQFNLKQFIVTPRGDDLVLDSLIVGKENQGKGLGTKAMQELIKYADSTGKRIILTPGLENKTHGTTSRARLVRFYKSLGFKENKGRSLDYAMGAGKMYRGPQSSLSEASVKLYTDPNYFGAEVDDTNLKNLPTTNIPLDKLVSYEPDSKMNQEKAKANVRKILQGLSKGENIPPILVRKYKNGYQVLDGHHRFYAYKLLKKKTIPAQIVSDDEIETVNEASGYNEIEFVCVNSQVPGTSLDAQRALYKDLKKLKGVIPLYQDWSEQGFEQLSLTAIYKDPALKKEILSLAKHHGVKVDLIRQVSDDYVDRALSGDHDYQILEASGYIPSAKEKNDPRFKTALTVDVKPDSIKDNAKRLGSKVSRAGIPPQANPNGKIAENLMKEWQSFLAEEQQELFPGYDEQHREKRLSNWLAKSWGVINGKPQIFYHATTKDFDKFNIHGRGASSVLGMTFDVERHGSFFAVDPKFAEIFVESPATGELKPGARVIPVHLSIQYPIDLRDNALSRMLSDEETKEEFKAHDIDLNSIYNHMYEDQRWELFDGPEGAEFVENLQKLGFDGAIINESIPNDSNAKSGEVWVVFNPNQVKSIHNRGSFSPNDPNLMRENG